MKQNQENRTRLNRNSRSGIRGVTWDTSRGKWRVLVEHNGAKHHGGRYADLADAETAAIALRRKLFTHNGCDRMQEIP